MLSSLVNPQSAVAATAASAYVPPQSFYSQHCGEPPKPPRIPVMETMTSPDWERDDIEIKFNELVTEWRANKSRASSFASRNAYVPAYQFIIGMGPKVLPFILRELIKQNEDWYWALKAIAREDPVPPENRGKLREMREAWLAWGRTKNYVR